MTVRSDGDKKHRLLPVFFILFLPLMFSGQPITGSLSQFSAWSRYETIREFYELNQYQYCWLGNNKSQKQLVNLIQSSDSFGLNKTDYQGLFFNSYNFDKPLLSGSDSLRTEISFADAAIHFFTELKYGSRKPSFRYEGLMYDPVNNKAIAEQLLSALKSDHLNELVTSMQPLTKEYRAMLQKLNWFQKIISGKEFKNAKIISSKVDETNKPLLLRLYQLGITDTLIHTANVSAIKTALRQAQALFDVLNDGILRTTAIAALNVSLKQRIEELRIALNNLRWINTIQQTSSVLLLNIPAAYFFVYENGSIILDSKAVVGKPSTPTPTLTSTITEVILYPYWMVPKKIAVKELLPKIKRNIGFLEDGNYQVLNGNGQVVNPYKINWSSLSASNFPYTIRQSTGCDNSLGVVKFNFYNPFTVYLHDTPYKGLFSLNKRYFSHGCMRVEKPLELAHLLLGANRVAIDTLTAKGCLYQQAPKIIAVEEKMPVIILYSTAWYTKEGELRFYDDVYNKLK